MSDLWARCNWLLSCSETLMGDHGRKIYVNIPECPPRALPCLAFTWEGWVEDPTPFTEAIVESLDHLRGAIRAINAIRAELERPSWLSSDLRDNFLKFFEEGFFKRIWLAGEGLSDLGWDRRMDLSCGEEVEVHVWLLTTVPSPVATLQRLCEMAKELLVEEERLRASLNEGGITKKEQSPRDPALTLGHKPGYVLALGEAVLIHTPEMLDLLKAMVEEYPSGLTLDRVREIHSKGNAGLKKLIDCCSHFAAAVALPGGPKKGGYRIRSVADAKLLLKPNELLPPEAKSDSVQ